MSTRRTARNRERLQVRTDDAIYSRAVRLAKAPGDGQGQWIAVAPSFGGFARWHHFGSHSRNGRKVVRMA
jgi:hypothetical protein